MAQTPPRETALECPRCGVFSLPGTRRCTCSYDFVRGLTEGEQHATCRKCGRTAVGRSFGFCYGMWNTDLGRPIQTSRYVLVGCMRGFVCSSCQRDCLRRRSVKLWGSLAASLLAMILLASVDFAVLGVIVAGLGVTFALWTIGTSLRKSTSSGWRFGWIVSTFEICAPRPNSTNVPPPWASRSIHRVLL
jgi:hypothetical protein